MVGETSAKTTTTKLRSSAIMGGGYPATKIPRSARSVTEVLQEKSSPVGGGTGTNKKRACYNNPMILYRSISKIENNSPPVACLIFTHHTHQTQHLLSYQERNLFLEANMTTIRIPSE